MEDKNDPPIVAIRRARLEQWIKERHDGVQARFVTETEINQGELSALLKTKSFGEKKARKIESQAGMPSGWLDQGGDAARPVSTIHTRVGQKHARKLVQAVCDLAAQINDDGLRELAGFARCLTGTHPFKKPAPAKRKKAA